MGLFRRRKDAWRALSEERREVEDERPWFAEPDDGPELRVETGIGSNLRDEDEDRDDPGGAGPAR